MQMNGGYFGSMMPPGATSFMPQGPTNPMMIQGVGSTPQGFTSPGMDPKILAMLTQMGKMADQSGNNSGALPPNSFSPFMANGGQAAPATGGAPGGGAAPAAGGAPGGGGIMDMLQKMDPAQIKGILSRLGIGGQMAGV